MHGKGDEELTVVYLDSLFLMNLGLDGLLLAAAQRLGGIHGQLWRTILAAAVGALYTAAVFCLRWSILTHPLVKVTVAVGMVLIASGIRGRPLRVLGLFFLLSCALAGGVLLMEVTGAGQLSNCQGIPATLADGRLLLVCGAGEYLAVSLVSLLPGAGGGGKVIPVLLRCEGRTTLIRVLEDSGNLLRDPMTGQSVLVAELEAVRGLFPKGQSPTEEELLRPAESLEAVSGRWCRSRWRLLPYQSVGTAKGLLLAVRVDEMEADGKPCRSRLVALTAERFPGEHQGVIGIEQGGAL